MTYRYITGRLRPILGVRNIYYRHKAYLRRTDCIYPPWGGYIPCCTYMLPYARISDCYMADRYVRTPMTSHRRPIIHTISARPTNVGLTVYTHYGWAYTLLHLHAICACISDCYQSLVMLLCTSHGIDTISTVCYIADMSC